VLRARRGVLNIDRDRGAIARSAEALRMTFVDSAELRGRRSGHIKLHGPEGFAGMRKAGRLTAEALDLLVERVKSGVTTNALDKFIY
jgi:hypothetical protein